MRGMTRTLAAASLVAVALLLATAVPGDAWSTHHGFQGRVFVGVGPFWWGPPYWYYPPPYYAYPPPPIVIQEPPVYVQPEPAAPAAPQSYWYYCPGVRAYYPNVQSCGETWIKVPARPQ
jgi:hypothetical protein